MVIDFFAMEFVQVIEGKDAFMDTAQGVFMALNGQVPKSNQRHLLWKVFLGVLPRHMTIPEWVQHLAAKRNDYRELKRKFTFDAATATGQVDVQINNPLSDNPDSSWNLYFRNQELLSEIQQDLNRLYPSGCDNFFQQKNLQEVLSNVLFAWANMYPDISYRQGMHELLAVMLYVLELEGTTEVDPLAIEATETKDIGPLYYVEKKHKKLRPGNPLTADTIVPPIIASCQRITDMLSKIDPDLSQHLTFLAIEPQLFCLRWLRLMFGREFHIDDTMVLWDWLLAKNYQFTNKEESSSTEGVSMLMGVECIAVSMLLYVKAHLIHSDETEFLQRVMHFPPVEDIKSLINIAQMAVKKDQDGQATLRNMTHDPLPLLPAPVEFVLQGVTKIAPLQEKQAHAQKTISRNVSLPNPLKSLGFGIHKEESHRLSTAQLEFLGEKLNGCIRMVEKVILKNNPEKSEVVTNVDPSLLRFPRATEVSQALAGMKRISDILCGHLEYDFCSWDDPEIDDRR